jgi:hypothetical protein
VCGRITLVGDIDVYVEDISVSGHIPVQKEKYYIIRINKWIFGNRLLHLYTESYLILVGK